MYIELLKDLDLGLENKLDTKVKYLSGGAETISIFNNGCYEISRITTIR